MPSVLNPSALTSLVNFKEALGLPTTADATNDNKYERFINRASDAIESLTGRKLKARRYNGGASTLNAVPDEDYLFFSGWTLDNGGDAIRDPLGYGVLHLPQFPVQPTSVLAFNLSVLSSRDTADTWDETSLVENRDYLVDRAAGVVRLLGGGFSGGFRNYRVTCAAGYATIPGDLEELCIEMAKKLMRNESGVTSESLGTWSKSYDVKAANAFIDATVALYRRF